MNKKNILVINLSLMCLLSSCKDDNITIITPSPISSNFTPLPIPSTSPIIIDNFFRVEFGPGSKGINNFGPGSKGINEFGPGTKGISNLRFNINFPDNLIRQDINSFTTKSIDNQQLKIENLKMSLQKSGQLIANIEVLPKSNNIIFRLDTNIEPGEYDLIAITNNNYQKLEYATLVKLESNLQIKVVLYAKDLKREDLDIAIRTEPINPSP
ncbi:MAG: hypothetical protein H7263_03480 [Candidatus Sericytochromatia bacterium]|nr:hypothetical protein [Candidatus Sericytochromatia bacterium]